MTLDSIKKEDRFAFAISLGFHLVLAVFFILYTFNLDADVRPSFIEIELGEYRTGTLTEYSEVKAEQVATRPDPSETQPENPQPDEPQPTEQKQTTTKETTKPVNAPEQKENVQEEELKTPKTDKVDPNQKAEQKEQEEITVPPKTEKEETVKEGQKTSGDEEGTKGKVSTEQGSGNDSEKSAPYELRWEGDIERDPMVQPLPDNTADEEATITVRFEVKPDGTIGRIIPLRKMNPELEREVMRTLRSWRFSRLPSGVPQQSQWGTITFRFVFE